MATLLIGDDLTTAAKNIRAELREQFPGVKFSVRSERFSGGDAIDIRWTDGPSADLVRGVVNKYKYGDFDGMTDSYNYARSEFNRQHGSAKYVQCQRDISESMIQRCIDEVAKKYGAKFIPTPKDFQNGLLWNTDPSGDVCNPNGPQCWQSLIWDQFSKM